MKSLNHSLRAMASFFASYLLDRFGDNIRQIFLFGSVARGEATADSDIDIFVDVSNIKSRILPAANDFEKTTNCKLFRSMGVKNPLRVISGNINDARHEDLRLAIASEGIILYGRGLQASAKNQPYLLVWWTAPKKQKQKVEFLRYIHGRQEKEKRYEGLLQKLNGLKVGRSTVLVPIRHKLELLKTLRRYKIKYLLKNIWV